MLARLRPLALVAVAALLAGCFQIDSVLTVRPDGSGEMRETVSADGLMAMGLLQTATELQPGQPAEGQQGLVVREVERTVLPGGARIVVTYDVPDVSELVYDPSDAVDPSALAGEMGAPSVEAEEEDASEPYRFRFTPAAGGAPAELRVVTPAPEFDAPDTDNPLLGGDGEMTPLESYETTMALFGSLAMRFAVVAEGELVDADGGWAEGDRVVLNEIAFGPLLSHLYELQGSVDEAAVLALDADLGDGVELPGFRAVAGGETTIRFR